MGQEARGHPDQSGHGRRGRHSTQPGSTAQVIAGAGGKFHTLSQVSAVFNDSNFVSCGGVAPISARPQRCGLAELVAEKLTLTAKSSTRAHRQAARSSWSMSPRSQMSSAWPLFCPPGVLLPRLRVHRQVKRARRYSTARVDPRVRTEHPVETSPRARGRAHLELVSAASSAQIP